MSKAGAGRDVPNQKIDMAISGKYFYVRPPSGCAITQPAHNALHTPPARDAWCQRGVGVPRKFRLRS